MFKYLVRRIVLFIPTLFVISLFTFMLSVFAPGDPVELMLNSSSKGEQGQSTGSLTTAQAYLDKRKELGLDLPIFYMAFGNQAVPDTLYRVPKKIIKSNLKKLINEHGNWPQISEYYGSLKAFDLALNNMTVDSSNASARIRLKDASYTLSIEHEERFILKAISEMEEEIGSANLKSMMIPLSNLRSAYQNVVEHESKWKNFVPSIKFYGIQNQYHRWLFGDPRIESSKGFFRGDFGISYKDGRPVKKVLLQAVRWTVLISIGSIILTYLIAIPLGVMSAAKKDSRTDKITTTFLFILYSLPSFWVATMLIMFFGGGDYLNWFPAYGIGQISDDMSFLEIANVRGYHLILPLICWTYGGLAYLSRQMRGGMLNILNQDFIRTARAKGLDQKKVLWKHAFRNSLLPVITLFASVFPLAISGSIVIEVIFSIPGMGKTAYEALVARNYPVVYAVVMFSAILTLIGYLVADILYAFVDPRIAYSSKK